MRNVTANIIGVALTAIIAFAGSLAILNYKRLNFSQYLEDSFDIEETFEIYEPEIFTGSVLLYRDFVMAVPITTDNIRDISHVVKVNGELKEVTLRIEASPTEFGWDKTRKHTVYFYVDTGSTGGHLNARREDARIVEGGFQIGDEPYVLSIDAHRFSVARGVDEQKEIRLLEILNDNNKHWIGAFVATGIYGILDRFSIEYTCADKTPDCEIVVVR